MTDKDLDDINAQLPALENILIIGFFKHMARPLRLMRLRIFHHDASTVPENLRSLSKSVIENYRMKE